MNDLTVIHAGLLAETAMRRLRLPVLGNGSLTNSARQ